MSTNLFADVRRFALLGGSPHFFNEPYRTLQLCHDLVQEEVVKEFLPALAKYASQPSLENMTEAVDGAIDGIYVLIFFLNQLGIDGQRMWDIVQAANMAKFPDGMAVKDENGKVQKPVGWQAPDQQIHAELIEWHSYSRGESYKGGIINQEKKHDC